jgi:hypothetical protein
MGRNQNTTPCCKYCNVELRPKYYIIRDHVPGLMSYEQPKIKIRITGYGYMGKGYFCSANCGWRYANEALDHNQPIRMQRTKEIVDANLSRGYQQDGLLSIGKILKIQEKMHDPDAVNEDEQTRQKLFRYKQSILSPEQVKQKRKEKS